VTASWLAVLVALASPADFERLCAPCHGPAGRGDGPAAHLYRPAPRDLVREPFRFGDDPESIARTIRRGVPGTGMPAFGERADALAADVLRLRGQAGTPPADPPPPADLERRAARGETVWRAAGCGACHGLEGAGDGPAHVADLPDLRSGPLRGGDAPADLFAAITRGRPGTPMPAFAAALPVDDRWALVAALGARRASANDLRARSSGAGAAALRSDEPTGAGAPDPGPSFHGPAPAGAGPFRAEVPDRLWPARPLPSQGIAPPGLVPARTVLDARACGRCHPREHAAWRASRHALAAGPGLRAQLLGATPAQRTACAACHAPLAEQQDTLVSEVEGREALGGEGVNCAGCHVRGHEKLGPPSPVVRRMLAPGLRATPEPRLARADACLPCHQLPAETAVAGRPLLDTWREWAASPYLPAGVQCQHCHQPDGDHAFSGAHDPDAVRRAVRLEVALDPGPAVRARVRVRNVAAGHDFPTTATPRAVLRVRQIDAAGRPLRGTEATWAIGRTVTWDGARWREIADTRLPPGGAGVWTYERPREPGAARLEVSLHFFPDWYYAGLYRDRLRRVGDPAARRDYEAALAAAEASPFLVAWERDPLP
jgi:mono/diheme cytochrome c family protein